MPSKLNKIHTHIPTQRMKGIKERERMREREGKRHRAEDKE